MTRDPDTFEARCRRGIMYRRDRKLTPGDYRAMVDLLEGGLHELKLQRNLLSHVSRTTDGGPEHYYLLAQAVDNMIDEVDLFHATFEELLGEVFVVPSKDDLK